MARSFGISIAMLRKCDYDMKIIGYYNEQGYQIESDNTMDAILYHAGNHAFDSQQDGTGTKHQLPLKTIKEYCEQTTIEIANEQAAQFMGVEYLEPGEI